MFDPAALLAVLVASYSPASPAALARAWRERPALFGGGTITGSKGDKLTLPSGEVWDLIFASTDPIARHWQMLQLGDEGPAVVDPFALERGPLDFLEPDLFTRPVREGTYEGLVAGAYADVAGGDAAISAPRAVIVDELASRDGFEHATAGDAEDANGEIEAQLAHPADVDITEVAAATDGLNDDASAKRDELPADNEFTAPFLTPPDYGPPPERGEPEPGDRQPPPKATPREPGGGGGG